MSEESITYKIASTDKKSPEYTYNAVVVRVVDGDTVIVNFDLGLGIWKYNETLRLLDVRCPEMVGADKVQGLAAKAIAMSVMPAGCSILVETHKDKGDKYGRYLAVIFRNINGIMININDTMNFNAPVGGK